LGFVQPRGIARKPRNSRSTGWACCATGW